MVKFYSTTLDELEQEVQKPKVMAQLGREAVLACLIGIEYDKEEVALEIDVPEEIEGAFELNVQTKLWREIFESNLQALIDTEEYQLLSMVKQLLEEDNDLRSNNERLLD